MRFRPCIDLRHGRVVQIVGSSLREGADEGVVTNFETTRAPREFAEMYAADDLPGGHVIALGPGNRAASLSALSGFPGGLHAGGGITPESAADYLEAGASHVIVTSYLFEDGKLSADRLRRLLAAVGKERLVLDLSCRRRGSDFWVVTDRWQTFTDVRIDAPALSSFAESCDEFLVHGVDVEGKRLGIETDLVRLLGEIAPRPVTYAGGVKALEDLDRIRALGGGRVDATIGSALDIFGGDISYRSVVEWQRREEAALSA